MKLSHATTADVVTDFLAGAPSLEEIEAYRSLEALQERSHTL